MPPSSSSNKAAMISDADSGAKETTKWSKGTGVP